MLCSTWPVICVLNNIPHKKKPYFSAWNSIRLFVSVPHAVSGVSLVGVTPLGIDSIVFILNFITSGIASNIATPCAVGAWDLQSLPRCEKMGLQKQVGDRREGLEDKDTKKERTLLLPEEICMHKQTNGQWPSDPARRRWCIHIVYFNVYLPFLSLPSFHGDSRGNRFIALKSRRISSTRSDPQKTTYTETRKGKLEKNSNEFHDHIKG